MTDRDCQRVFALLSEHLDQELPLESCEELERHIQGCAPCVEFVESLKKSVALGRTYRPETDVPPIPEPVKQALREAYARAIGKGGE